MFTTHLCQVGVVAARQGYAYAANAPLTGFHSGSELPKQACRRLLITPSLFTSVLVTKAAYGFDVLYPFQTSAGSRRMQIFSNRGFSLNSCFLPRNQPNSLSFWLLRKAGPLRIVGLLQLLRSCHRCVLIGRNTT